MKTDIEIYTENETGLSIRSYRSYIEDEIGKLISKSNQTRIDRITIELLKKHLLGL